MTRTDITIAILATLIVVLGVFCYVGKPLFVSQNAPVIEGFVKDIEGTSVGQTVLKHYASRFILFAKHKFGHYDELELDNMVWVHIFQEASLFAASIALVGFIASLALFVINSEQQTYVSKYKLVLTVSMVILAGTAIRLILAAVIYGNYDMESYDMVADIISKGGNVYAETYRYNYSPVWFIVLSVLKRIQLVLPDVPFHFIVRSFLCGIDLLTLMVLLLIAGICKLPVVRTAIFFYLSPVSFLVTGYHGQFENMAMLMVLVGIYLYLRFAARPVLRVVLLWLFTTAGMIVKHNTFYELIICLHSSVKRYWVKISLFVVSVVIFLSLFIPYWDVGKKGIIENVFGYGSAVGIYGVTSLFEGTQLFEGVHRAAIYFYLSPVSFLVRQFENMVMLMMVLIGIYLYLWFADRSFLRVVLLWLFTTTGMIVKHNALYELVICLHSFVKRYWVKIFLFLVLVIIFLSLFIPYWDVGKKRIIGNVFGYGSRVGIYGVTSLLEMAQLKYLFISAMFIFPLFLKSKDIIAQCLLVVLFFLIFTTGIAIQYFVLPLALGALRPSKVCLLYTFLATLFILGSVNNVHIPGFELFQWNLVWIGAVCWFIAEMRLDRQANEVAVSKKDKKC